MGFTATSTQSWWAMCLLAVVPEQESQPVILLYYRVKPVALCSQGALLAVLNGLDPQLTDYTSCGAHSKALLRQGSRSALQSHPTVKHNFQSCHSGKHGHRWPAAVEHILWPAWQESKFAVSPSC